MKFILKALIVSLSLYGFNTEIKAQTLRERIKERMEQRAEQRNENDSMKRFSHFNRSQIPDNIKILKDISYGSSRDEKMDIYVPKVLSTNAPVIFMVHGGAWEIGDKTMSRVVENKVSYWGSKGFIFISINYPMLPETSVLQQTQYVANALKFAQINAPSWSGDKNKFILMGHSAGAHLVSYLSASPSLTARYGIAPWLATISLDSAVYDVTAIMNHPHEKLYDKAFGTDVGYWIKTSPITQLSTQSKENTSRMLLVCSSKREVSCQQSQNFADKANAQGMNVKVLAENMSHGEINEELGANNSYTQTVDQFIQESIK